MLLCGNQWIYGTVNMNLFVLRRKESATAGWMWVDKCMGKYAFHKYLDGTILDKNILKKHILIVQDDKTRIKAGSSVGTGNRERWPSPIKLVHKAFSITHTLLVYRKHWLFLWSKTMYCLKSTEQGLNWIRNPVSVVNIFSRNILWDLPRASVWGMQCEWGQ